MAYVVAEPCIKCKFTDCVTACPVDCFREGPNMLAIDPMECIDCRACVDHCPVNAIYHHEALPPQWAHYARLNRQWAKQWPDIDRPKPPMPEAEAYAKVLPKAQWLEAEEGTP